MTPVDFEQANTLFKAPDGFADSQVVPIPAHTCQAVGGSCDGVPLVIVAWMPSEEELKDLIAGKLVFLTILGELPPHFLSTRFEQSINPA